MVAALLLAGLDTLAHGRETRGGQVSIKGKVVCAGCSLDELRNTPAERGQLYQFTRDHDRVVMQVQAVNDNPLWRSFFGWPAEIPVRSQDAVFQRLLAEENLFKEVEITGVVSTTRALDIFDVSVHG
jgi:hypothetical protein